MIYRQCSASRSRSHINSKIEQKSNETRKRSYGCVYNGCYTNFRTASNDPLPRVIYSQTWIIDQSRRFFSSFREEIMSDRSNPHTYARSVIHCIQKRIKNRILLFVLVFIVNFQILQSFSIIISSPGPVRVFQFLVSNEKRKKKWKFRSFPSNSSMSYFNLFR